MIFLKEANLLFLKPFKVAGTSFEIALSRFAGSNDIISELRRDDHIRQSLGYPGERNYKFTWRERLAMRPTRQLKLLYHKHERIKYPQHTSAEQARTYLGASTFDNALKISIVRNPFDFLVSHYFWHNKNNNKPKPSLASWLRKNPWVFGRNDQFYYLGARDIIDYYIRFETLLEDTKKLEAIKPQLSGLSESLSRISAKSGIRPDDAKVENMFKDQPLLIRTVQFFYEEHIKRFGYTAPF